MAQLRQDHEAFAARDTEVVAIGPEKPEAFRKYWDGKDFPFLGLPDPERLVLRLYGQQVKILKLGRMPAQVLVDREGLIRYVHYGSSMSDIPSNLEILSLIDGLNQG